MIDGCSPDSASITLDTIITSHLGCIPRFVWIDHPAVGRTFVQGALFNATSRRVAALMILQGDCNSFPIQLRQWLRWLPKTTVAIRHSKPKLLLTSANLTSSYREWLARTGCDPTESVVDALIDETSLRALPAPERIRRFDLYVLDRLAQARYPLTLGDLARSLTDTDSYVFASKLESHGPPNGYSSHSVKNAVSRLRRAIGCTGVDGHTVIRTEDDSYLIDRSVVDVTVMHVEE